MIKNFDVYLGRFVNVYTLLALLAPPTLVGIFTAYLSQGVVWIQQAGPFGWWCAFLFGAVICLLAHTLFAIAQERVARAHAIKKWSREVDSVNPLDITFNRKRINLSYLANPTSKLILNKRFTDCELIGPVNILITDGVELNGISFIQCDLVPVKDKSVIHNAIGIKNTQIIGGSICNATIFLHEDNIRLMARGTHGVRFTSLTGIDEFDKLRN